MKVCCCHQSLFSIPANISLPVHPNVDKKSFIRWKQRDIHEKREVLKHDIRRLEASIEVNTELTDWLDRLARAVAAAVDSRDAAFQRRFLCEVAYDVRVARGDSRKARPVANPQAPTYDDMVDSLVEQVLEKVVPGGADDEALQDDAKVEAMVKKFGAEIENHRDKLLDMLKEEQPKYNELVEERSRHIISEDLHTGFDSTLLNKDAEKAPEKTPAASASTQSIEVINSPGASKPVATAASDDDDDPDNIKASPLALEFSKIPIGDYAAAEAFLHKHPSIATEREKDALTMEAFTTQFAKDEAATERIVHNALILQYCATFGPKGVDMFFTRVVRGAPHARQAFEKDVEFTVNHIKTRCKILAEEERARKASGEEDDDEEAIVQLQPSLATGDELSVVVPPTDSDDPEVQRIREAYETLGEDLRAAVESKSLKKVNAALAELSFAEGEAVVQFFEATGIFNLDGNIYDADEYKQKLEEEKAKAKEDAKK